MNFGLRYRHTHGDFLGRWPAAELASETLEGVRHFIGQLDHVNRDADGVRMIRKRASDGLAYPPTGVGREAETKPVIELIDGAQQTDITFLNEIQVTEPVAAIFLRNGGD